MKIIRPHVCILGSVAIILAISFVPSASAGHCAPEPLLSEAVCIVEENKNASIESLNTLRDIIIHCVLEESVSEILEDGCQQP